MSNTSTSTSTSSVTSESSTSGSTVTTSATSDGSTTSTAAAAAVCNVSDTSCAAVGNLTTTSGVTDTSTSAGTSGSFTDSNVTDYRYDFTDTSHYTYGIWNPTLQYDSYLRLVIFIGFGFSIFSLLIFTLIIVWNKSLHVERYMVHLNLAIAVLISQSTFLFIDLAKDDPTACLTVAVLLQFSLLAMSIWLLNEGFYLFPAFTSGTLTGRMKYYIPLAWSVPMIVVIVCVNVGADGYARDPRCYLTFDEDHKWMFAGPALVITAGVLIIFALLLCNISHPAIKDPLVKTELFSSFISYLLLVLILLSVWTFGGLASIHDTQVIYQMIFVGVMTIKGMLIFCVYGLLSPKFRYCLYPRKPSKVAVQLDNLPAFKTEMSSGDPGLLPNSGFKAGTPLYIP